MSVAYNSQLVPQLLFGAPLLLLQTLLLLLLLLLQALLGSLCLLLEPLLGNLRLLLETLLELLLLLQHLLLVLPLLGHERLDKPFVALIAPPRCFRGGAPILDLLLHQLRLLLLLLLQKVKDYTKIGASI